MDASAGLTASQKALETVRALPAWLLAALLLSTGLVWLARRFAETCRKAWRDGCHWL